MTPDSELLCQYAEHGDQAAFAEVVRRQVDLVYSAALRVVNGDTHLAEDVTQKVFSTLAREAGPLSRHPSIIGWLHTTARHAAIKAVRGEQRRRHREQEALAMQNLIPEAEINWELLRPALDEAVDQLPDFDREAVLLRFFKGLSHREVGEVLGMTEDTARKRVERALEKLREHFSRRGIGVSAMLLAEVINANSVSAAPVGLAARVTGTSLVGAAGASGTFLSILFMSTKNKIVLIVAVLLMVGASFWFTMRQPAESPAPAKKDSSQSGSISSLAVASSSTKAAVVEPPAMPPASANSSRNSSTIAATPSSSPPDGLANATTTEDNAMREKLNQLKMPQISVSHANLSEIVKMFSGMFNVKMAILANDFGPIPDPEASISGGDLPLVDMLDSICKQTGFTWAVENGIVILRPPANKTP